MSCAASASLPFQLSSCGCTVCSNDHSESSALDPLSAAVRSKVFLPRTQTTSFTSSIYTCCKPCFSWAWSYIHRQRNTGRDTDTHTDTHRDTHTNKTTLFSRTWSWPSLHRDGSSDPTLRRYARHCCTKQATSVLLSQRDVSLSRPLLLFFFFVFVGTTLSVIVTDHNSGNHRNLKR